MPRPLRPALALLGAAFLVFAPEAVAQAPAPGEVVVNEIAYDPPAPQLPGNEWIEVVNRGERTVDLAGLAVGDEGGASDPIAGPLAVAPGAFVVLVRNGESFEAAYPGVAYVEVDGFPLLNNTGDRVSISVGATELDAVPYERDWGGEDASLERRDPDGPSADPANWATSTAGAGGTPGAENSVFSPDVEPPSLVSAEAESATSVILVVSEPVTPESAEAPEAYAVSDGIGAPLAAALVGDGTRVRLTLATPLPGLGTYTLTASGLSDRAGNVLASGSVAFAFGEGAAADPRDLVVNEFLYDEPSADNPGEFVELFNRTDKTFDLADFTLNDGTGDDEPVTDRQRLLGPGEYAVIVEDGALFAAVFPGVAFVEQPTWSALNNSGDAIVLKYRGATVDSLLYAPSWGGEDASLERKDPDGPSSVAVNWATTQDLRGGTPGEENSRFEPDVTGPAPLAVEVAATERALTVTFSEPLAPEAVLPGAFEIVGGPDVATAVLSEDGTAVTLGLSDRLPSGALTLVARGLSDRLGNATPEATLAFDFERDETAPGIATAAALSDRVVRVRFTESVAFGSGAAASTYSLDGGIGTAQTVEVVELGDGTAAPSVLVVDVTFPSPLADRTLYTLTARGLRDLAGNSGDATAAVFFGTPDVPLAGDLAITEILYDPQTGGDGEYVEVLNTTADRLFDLRTLTLDDEPGTTTPISFEPVVLAPGARLAIVADLERFRETFPDAPAAEADRFPGLGNAGDLVVLSASGVVIDSVRYSPDWHRVELEDATGISLERRDPAVDANSAANWSSSLDPRGGTPSAENSIGVDAGPPPEAAGLSFSASPFRAEDGVGISYTLEAEAALVRVRVFDGAGRQVRELEDARLSAAQGTLIWDGRADDGERLRIGPYVVLLEAVDAEGGTTEAHKGVVVLAREL